MESLKIYHNLEKINSNYNCNYLQVRDLMNLSKKEIGFTGDEQHMVIGTVTGSRMELVYLEGLSSHQILKCFWSTVYTVTDGIYDIDVVSMDNATFNYTNNDSEIIEIKYNKTKPLDISIGDIVSFDSVMIPRKKVNNELLENNPLLKEEESNLENENKNIREIEIMAVLKGNNENILKLHNDDLEKVPNNLKEPSILGTVSVKPLGKEYLGFNFSKIFI